MAVMSRPGNWTIDTVVPSTTVTASGNSAAFGSYGGAREIVLQINVTAVSGTTPSLTVNLQDTVDGTNYNTVASSSAITTTGTTVIRVPITTPFTNMLRLNYAVSGTTPSFTLVAQGYFATAANYGV